MHEDTSLPTFDDASPSYDESSTPLFNEEPPTPRYDEAPPPPLYDEAPPIHDEDFGANDFVEVVHTFEGSSTHHI